MGGRWVPRLDRPLSRFFFWSLFTSLLALILARLPGLVPVLSASAPRSLLKSGPFAGRILHSRYLKRAALGRAVGAVAVAGIMVAAAFAGAPGLVHPVTVSIPSVLVNNSSSPPFFPYLVPASDYPSPVNLSLGGNVSLPQMAVTATAGIPSYHLLAISQRNGTYAPVLVTGTYSEGLARSIAEGCSSHPAPPGHGGNASQSCSLPSLPVTWTVPVPLNVSGSAAIFSSPVTGDAFAVGGPVWAVAITSQGSTTLFVSRDNGGNWTDILDPVGNSPSLQVTSGTVILALTTPSAILTEVVPPSGNILSGSFPASQVTSGSFLSAALVTLPSSNASLPELGILASDTDQEILFAHSNDSGAQWIANVFAAASNSTGSAIFNQIGATALFMPGGDPDMVAASANGSRVFALWTSSVGDGVDALTAVSPNGGATWLGPYESNAPTSVGSPTLVPMPAGYVAADWRSGTSGTGFAVYGPDGRPVENVQTLPSPTGAGSGTALGVDLLERLFFAWPSSNGSALEFTGGFLSPTAAVENWLNAIEALPSGDFVAPTVTNNSTTNSTLSALEGKLGALLHKVSGPGGLTGAIEQIEQDLYPRVTSLPLILGCTGPVPVCGHLHRGHNLPWIVNESGPLAANTYLAVYAMWTLESLGVLVSVPPVADPGDLFINTGDPVTWAPCGSQSSCTYGKYQVSGSDTETGTLSLQASLTDPTTITLDLSDFFPSLTVTATGTIDCAGVHEDSAQVTAFPENISYSIGIPEVSTSVGGHGGGGVLTPDLRTTIFTEFFNFTRSYTDNPLTIQLTGINPSDFPNPSQLEMTINATAQYGPSSLKFGQGNCIVYLPGIPLPQPTLSTGRVAVSLGVESLTPNPPLVQETPSGGTSFDVTITGTTSLPSLLFANATVNATGEKNPFTDTTYSNTVTATTPLAAGTYFLSGKVLSMPGGASLDPSDYQIPVGHLTGIGPLTATFSCPITVVNVNLGVSNLIVSGVGSTTAEVYWTTNIPALSQITVVEVGVGIVLQTENTTLSTTHTLVLSGLSPFGFYTVFVGALLPSTGCLVVKTGLTEYNFHTAATFSVSEKDLPYDSISKEGGGALVSWNLPSTPLTFTSGFLQYTPGGASQATNVPIETLTPVSKQVSPNTYDENLSTLTPNTAYTVTVYLNLSLTVGGTVYTLTATGSVTFTYLKDSSNDGLSDAEKSLGWYVTYTDSGGTSHIVHVTANPADYATNGLVSDYVEKEFGLMPFNPDTGSSVIDTAGSHMLDTYNLTFDLGSNGVPSNIQAWTEPTVNPFASAPVPNGTPPKGDNPIGTDWTNLSDMATAGDNYPWASEVLWDYNSLLYLNGLAYSDGDWLRGVTGSWNGHNTLTVWGKLSWGANPLAASTPGDGIADGARVNPVHEVDLQIFIAKSGLLSCGENLNQGAGYADQFFVNATNPTGQNEGSLFHGFSASGFDKNSNCQPSGSLPFNIFDYFLVIPVGGQTTQFVHIDTQLVVNNNLQGNNTLPLQELPITNNCQDTVSVTVDLVNPPYAPFQATDTPPITGGCTTGSNPAFLDMGVTAVPAGVKSQTFLWLPNDNSTLSSLPQGLQRYTGEQNFFLVTANVTELPNQGTFDESALTSDPIAEPWSSTKTYKLNIPLTAGVPPSPTHALVNFLIPRAQFLASPFGQAVLLNTQVPGASSLGGSLLSDIFSNSADQNQQALECYWQTNAFTSGTTVTGCGGGTGGAFPDPFHSIQVLSLSQGASAASCEDAYPSLCGGVPGNSALSSVAPSPALQGVIALNLSILDPNYNPSSVDLDTLLAGLLDNSTGGVNGTFRDETQNLSSLGLNPVVMQALANGVWDSGGIFGAPTSFAQPPPPSPPGCNNFIGCVWNTVSGVVAGIAGAIYGAVWTAVEAATQFLVQLGAGLASLAEAAEQAAVSVMTAVGHALEAALRALEQFVLNAVETLMTATFKVVWGAISTVSNDLMQLQAIVAANIVSYMTGSGSLGAASSSLAIAVAPFLIFSAAITVLIDIVLGITTPVSVGVSLLLGLLITVVINVVGSGSVNQQGQGALSSILSIIQSALAGTVKTFVAAAEDALNFTFQSVLGYTSFSTADLQLIGDPPNYIGAFLGGVFTGLGIFGVALKLVKLSKLAGDAAAQFGFTLSLLSLALGLHVFLFKLSQPNGCNQLPKALVNGMVVENSAGAGFGGIGFVLNTVAAIWSDNPDDRELAGFGTVLSLFGLVGSGYALYADNQCETTAT